MVAENGLIKLAVLACGLQLAIYWGTVAIKSWRIRRKIGKDPNVIPREPVGRLMRLLWAPAVAAWCVQPWLFVLATGPRAWMLSPVSAGGRTAAILAVVGGLTGGICLVLTFICWRQMGRSWRIGIDPKEKTELVVKGACCYVRHPIYALSMFLMIGTVIALPTPLMVLTAIIHISMLQIEARREEAHLIQLHGQQYQQYRTRVGRFIPRVWQR